VIAVVEVAEFVDGDVVDDPGRGHHALPVEIQGAGAAAAGPAVAHVFDPNLADLDTYLGRVMCDAIRVTLLALVGVERLEGLPGV